MSLVRNQLLLLSMFCFSVVSATGALAYLSYENLIDLRADVEKSYRITSHVAALNGGLPADVKAELEALSTTLKPEFRAKAVAAVIERPNSKKDVAYALKAESEYRTYLSPTQRYLESRIRFYSLICTAAVIALMSGLYFFVVANVFKPLDELSRRMVDFLNQRYTYQFTVPEPNEVGRLHATFNALAQRVLQQIEDLKSLDKAKSEFLSIASHELRTPLTSIKGSMSLLQSGIVGQMNEAAQNLLKIGLNETDRLVRIINEFLDLAKIEAKQFPLHLGWSSALSIGQNTVEGISGFAATAKIKLTVECENQIEVNVDKDRIQQVLTNLVSNAIKFSPPEGEVRISITLTEDRFVQFAVKDQGRGIAPEDQALIFEKFRQATSAENPLVKGTGLGLAIAKALVEQHGGSIGVQSKPGEGSTFYFTVPEWRLSSAREAMAS